MWVGILGHQEILEILENYLLLFREIEIEIEIEIGNRKSETEIGNTEIQELEIIEEIRIEFWDMIFDW